MLEGLELDPEGFEAQIKALTCPVCQKIPLGNIIVCDNGHSLCEDCVNRQSTKVCSICGTSMEGVTRRNLAIENFLDYYIFHCPHRDKGCNITGLKRSEVRPHADTCEHNGNVIRLCQWMGFSDCEEIFSFRDPTAYLQHVADGTHCSHGRVEANDEFQSFLIPNFRRIHDPDFVFMPKLFHLNHGVKILLTHCVPAEEDGCLSTDIYFMATLMEDNRPTFGGENPRYYVHFTVGQQPESLEWAQPVVNLETSKQAMKRYFIGQNISSLQLYYMNLEDTDLEFKIKFIHFATGQ